MIKPEELRIGNLVFDLSRKREVVIWGIESNHDRVVLNYANGSGVYGEDLKNIQSISLTEEWLLKFGFEKGSNETNKKCFYKRDFVFIFYSDGIGGRFSKCFFQNACTHTLSEIKYVHQLQNLYFALTGEELQLKN